MLNEELDCWGAVMRTQWNGSWGGGENKPITMAHCATLLGWPCLKYRRAGSTEQCPMIGLEWVEVVKKQTNFVTWRKMPVTEWLKTQLQVLQFIQIFQFRSYVSNINVPFISHRQLWNRNLNSCQTICHPRAGMGNWRRCITAVQRLKILTARLQVV